MTQTPSETYPIVYSYKKSRSRELELSMLSLRNLKEWNGEIYVIGNKPPLQGVKHIKIAYSWGKESRNRHNDEICAYLTAADLYDDFIIFADDIMVLQPWSLTSHNKGTLKEAYERRRRHDSYRKQLERTEAFLLKHGKPTLCYELHIPFLVNSKQLKEVAEIIPKTSEGVLIRSVLGNWFDRDSTHLDDVKNIPLNEDTVLYSSSDTSFNYSQVEKYLQ